MTDAGSLYPDTPQAGPDDGFRPVAHEGADPVPAEATVSGPASALYLLLWRRTGLDDPRLTITGDESAARSVLGAAIVP